MGAYCCTLVYDGTVFSFPAGVAVGVAATAGKMKKHTKNERNTIKKHPIILFFFVLILPPFFPISLERFLSLLNTRKEKSQKTHIAIYQSKTSEARNCRGIQSFWII